MPALLVLALLLSSAGLALAQTTGATDEAKGQALYEFLLGRRLEAQGDASGALAAFNRALALDAQSAELHAELAGYHARQNNAAEAVQAAEKALGLNPNNTEAHRMLGLVLAAWSESGSPPPGRNASQLRTQAIGHLTRILETPAIATDLNLQLTLARLLLRNTEHARAVPILENIVTQAPFATEPYSLLAEGRVALGRIDGAIEALTAAAELNPRYFASLGDLLERQERWADAAKAYEQALAGARGNAVRDLRLRYAAALINTSDAGSAGKARDVLKDLLMTAPRDARALFLLSSANLRLGDLAGAETVARQLLANDASSLPGLHALSTALVARREYRQVVELLSPLAAEGPDKSNARGSDTALLLSQLAHAHTQLGDHTRAVAVLTTAVNNDPMSAPALNSLGYTLADRGERLDEAVGYIERALKVDPGNPSYVDSLGWALFKQGRVSDAEKYLREAAEALPGNSVIQDHFGDVLARQGKLQEAATAWERALKGDGEEIDRTSIERKLRDARAKKP